MKKIGSIVAAFVLPLVASAQGINNVWDIFGFIKRIMDTVLPLIIALAVIYFIWGMFQLVTAGDDEKKDKAKTTIIYGVVALFVMISVWGLVNILVNTFGLNNNATINNPLPQIPNTR